ncbi:hypothetical protein ASZ90_017238 [hydrocarbon metagenome]|uniref:Uncharacterized protein n=1 Tax=hydrocarbon metagenome TaxID=938273 RepID=A0A0W8E9M4_9ZZZZ
MWALHLGGGWRYYEDLSITASSRRILSGRKGIDTVAGI